MENLKKTNLKKKKNRFKGASVVVPVNGASGEAN